MHEYCIFKEEFLRWIRHLIGWHCNLADIEGAMVRPRAIRRCPEVSERGPQAAANPRPGVESGSGRIEGNARRVAEWGEPPAGSVRQSSVQAVARIASRTSTLPANEDRAGESTLTDGGAISPSRPAVRQPLCI